MIQDEDKLDNLTSPLRIKINLECCPRRTSLGNSL